MTYHIVGKFGKLGKSSIIRQTKTIQVSTVLSHQNWSPQKSVWPDWFWQKIGFAKIGPPDHFGCQNRSGWINFGSQNWSPFANFGPPVKYKFATI